MPPSLTSFSVRFRREARGFAAVSALAGVLAAASAACGSSDVENRDYGQPPDPSTFNPGSGSSDPYGYGQRARQGRVPSGAQALRAHDHVSGRQRDLRGAARRLRRPRHVGGRQADGEEGQRLERRHPDPALDTHPVQVRRRRRVEDRSGAADDHRRQRQHEQHVRRQDVRAHALRGGRSAPAGRVRLARLGHLLRLRRSLLQRQHGPRRRVPRERA